MHKMYCVKYAMTTGRVSEVDCTPGHADNTYVYSNDRFPTQYCVGRDAFYEHADAVAAAIVMRDKKVKSLEKQILKLKAMVFA